MKFLVIVFSRPIFLPRTEIVSAVLLILLFSCLKYNNVLVFDILNFQTLHCMPSTYVILYRKRFNLQRKEKIVLSMFSIICAHLSGD